MPDPKEKHLKHVVADLRRAQNDQGRPKCALLIGAGVSVTAGIKGAAQIVRDLQDDPRYAAHLSDLPKPRTYAACMSQLTTKERRDLFEPMIQQAKVNTAHLAIAQLVKHGYVDRILTTNFDPLLVQACALLYEYPAVYDFAASQQFDMDTLRDPSICYLHGQSFGAFMKNTPDEMEEQAERLRPLIRDTLRTRTLIVVGYGGDDPVFDVLKDEQKDSRIQWVTYQKEDPAAHVRTELLEANSYATFVRAENADAFFALVAQELDCFPPSFVEQPFGYVYDLLDRLMPYVLPGSTSEQDYREVVRERVQQAEQALGSATDTSDVPLQMTARLMEGRPDLAAQLAQAQPESDPQSPLLRDLKAWAYFEQALRASAEADAATDPAEQIRLRREEIAKYEQAVAVKPEDHDALYNWGNALRQLADAEPEQRAEHLKAAIAKYEQAVAVKPDLHEALNNWGYALGQLADAEPERRAEHLKAAIVKYEQAVAVKPEDHDALYNWGIALVNLADAESEHRAEHLRAAIAMYEQAVAVKPDKHEALYNWAIALGRLADTEPVRREELVREAEARIAEAERFRPDAAFYGRACLAAVLRQPARAQELLEASLDAGGYLPSRAHLLGDLDFAAYRDEAWFRDFVERAYPSG